MSGEIKRTRVRGKRVLLMAGVASLGVVGALVAASVWVSRHGSPRVVIEPDELVRQVEGFGITTVIVPGAGVDADGTPALAAKSRAKTAYGIYRDGLVDTILVSGSVDDNGDEPAAMHSYVLGLGASAEDVIVDDEGTSTWRTCERAVNEFGVTSAVIVTQYEFGPRAALTCHVAGIDPVVAYTPRRLKSGADASVIIREGFSNLKLAGLAARQRVSR